MGFKKYEELAYKEDREFQNKAETLYVANDIRLGHSEDLKNEVIKPWIKKLPSVEFDGVFISNSYGLTRHRYLGGKLPVEDETLFEDF